MNDNRFVINISTTMINMLTHHGSQVNISNMNNGLRRRDSLWRRFDEFIVIFVLFHNKNPFFPNLINHFECDCHKYYAFLA